MPTAVKYLQNGCKRRWTVTWLSGGNIMQNLFTKIINREYIICICWLLQWWPKKCKLRMIHVFRSFVKCLSILSKDWQYVSIISVQPSYIDYVSISVSVNLQKMVKNTSILNTSFLMKMRYVCTSYIFLREKTNKII